MQIHCSKTKNNLFCLKFLHAGRTYAGFGKDRVKVPSQDRNATTGISRYVEEPGSSSLELLLRDLQGKISKVQKRERADRLICGYIVIIFIFIYRDYEKTCTTSGGDFVM